MQIDGKVLPTRLRVQPIVDAIAEVRFATSVDASLILPGFLLNSFPGAQVRRLPAAELPEVMRQTDENLKHQPLIRVEHENFFFLIGSASLAVGCGLPYPGWTQFESMIQKAIKIANDTGLVSTVNRYSLKYSDVIECSTTAEGVEYLDVKINVAGLPIGPHGFDLEFPMHSNGMVHLIKVALLATIGLIDETSRRGVFISVDSIAAETTFTMADFANQAVELYSAMHSENKKRFFSCLAEETLQRLGAEYV